MARVLVAGAGALGSVFGGFLRLAGDDVTLLGRPQHLEAIARQGLSIDGLWGTHTASGFNLATSPAQIAGPYDAVLLTVKSFDTAAVVASIAHLLTADGVMISLQNGLGNVEQVREHVGAQRALGGRVIFGAEIVRPGCVRVTVFAEPVLLGASRGETSDERNEAVAEAHAHLWSERLDRAGVPTRFTSNVHADLWGKAFYNAALNPLGALLGVHYGALMEDVDTRAIMDEVIAEAHAVACSEGMHLPWATAEAYREVFYGRLVPSTYDHRSSMLQDLERGRRTEIDAINGAIWKRGAARGMVTPFNELLTRLLHARSNSKGTRRDGIAHR